MFLIISNAIARVNDIKVVTSFMIGRMDVKFSGLMYSEKIAQVIKKIWTI